VRQYQNRKTAMNVNHLIMLILLSMLISCKNNRVEKPHSYTVTRYQKVGEGYAYSKDLFRYQSSVYRPMIRSEYHTDTLVSVLVFKPEGKIIYSNADLKADPLFFQMLNIPHKRSVEIDKGHLIDNGKSHQIIESRGDSIYCVQMDTLTLYRFN